MPISIILGIFSVFGMLMSLISFILFCMGFGKFGIASGSVAASIQSINKVVHKGSIFSIFQSIGMTLGYINTAIIGLIISLVNPGVLQFIHENVSKSVSWITNVVN